MLSRPFPRCHNNCLAETYILLNDFRRQWADTGEDTLRAVEEVGRSGWYVLGERVRRFEDALRSYWGFSEAAGVASGLDAIEIGLRAAGLQSGDRVLTTPLSAFATTLAIVRAGGIPVFCDTDATGRIDLNEARAALQAMPGIRFFVPVHLYGFPIPAGDLGSLIREFSLVCIEDCAQSIGATENGRPTGQAGLAAATSFYPTKNLGALGDGGALLTNDSAFAESVRCLRDYGQSAKYVHSQLGWNSRLDEVQAAILSAAALPRLARWTGRRREIARRCLAQWPSAAAVPLGNALPSEPGCEPCWHLFPVRTNTERKRDFMHHLRAHGIQSGEHYPALIPDQPAMQGSSFACFGPLEAARSIAGAEVSIPIHPYLTDEEVDAVVHAIRIFV